MKLPPWLQPLAERTADRLASSELPHALLITGPEGWGERLLANRLALTVLGIGDDRDAALLAHPDLRWLEPEGAVIKVEMVRELVTFTQGTPQGGPRKVAVLADAHCLNRSSANALLKTLEEPPPDTHLVLYTCHAGRLLPTIRSRCQKLVIRPDAAMARQWLESRVPADVDLGQRLFEYGGAPVAVLAALERGEQPLAGLFERPLGADRGPATVKALLDAGLADALARWYRYALALAAGHWRPRHLSAVSPRALMAFADEVTWARGQLVTSNSANQRLLAERIVSRWRALEAGGP